jgi:hypothetical protein
MLNRILSILVLAVSCCAICLAQKNEASVLLGTTFTSDQSGTTTTNFPCVFGIPNCNVFTSSVQMSHGFAIEGNYARELMKFGPVAALYVEVPLIAVTNQNQKLSISNSLIGNVNATVSASTLFFTPSAKLKLLPSLPISPFVSAGGGLAHFGLPNSSTNKGAIQFGGGVDIKTPVPMLGVRAEVRDFYTGSNFSSSSNTFATTEVSTSHIHNVFVGGGVTLRF